MIELACSILVAGGILILVLHLRRFVNLLVDWT